MLEPFFVETRTLFCDAGFSRCSATKLEIDGEAHDTPRHFAGCRDDGRLILAAPEMADLPVDNVVAIFSHEFGHAVDFLYPTRFQLVVGELEERKGEWSEGRRLPTAEMPAAFARGVMRQWRGRDDDEVERLADAIAERVVGRPVAYTGPCLLQTFGAGAPRPEGLR